MQLTEHNGGYVLNVDPEDYDGIVMYFPKIKWMDRYKVGFKRCYYVEKPWDWSNLGDYMLKALNKVTS